MRIKYHFCLEKQNRLVEFLERYHVIYDVTEISKSSLCTFQLYEDQEAYRRFKKQFPMALRYDSLKMIEYSKSDIENAEWLIVRNKSTKVTWNYDEKAFYSSCSYKKFLCKEMQYKHPEQVNILSSTRAVKWSTRQFFSGPNSADDIIFCSEKARQILDNKWQGLEFLPVKKSNTSQYIPDLYQLFFKKILPVEAIRGGVFMTCRNCGKKMIRISKELYQLEFDKKYFLNPYSVYTTGNVLTTGLKGNETFFLNIVSQEFYQYCEKYQMNRGMIYEPIKLI